MREWEGWSTETNSFLLQIKKLAFRDGEFLTEVRIVMLENSSLSPANLLESTNISGREDLFSKLFPLQFVGLLAKREAP